MWGLWNFVWGMNPLRAPVATGLDGAWVGWGFEVYREVAG